MNEEQFLEALRSYIEQSEVEFDVQAGGHRDVKALVLAGKMPPVYGELLKKLYVAIGGRFKRSQAHQLQCLADRSRRTCSGSAST